MKKIKLLLASTFLAFTSFGQMSIYDQEAYNQTTPLDCGTLAAGGVNFVDQGGNYGPNMDEYVVFCPDLNQGSKVSIAFAINIGYEFNIDPTDTLYIYDGFNFAAPLLGAFNSGTNPNGFNVQASFANNTSGCLTARFRSDGSAEGTGWIAKVACGDLPQPIQPHLEAFVNGGTTNALNPIDTGYVNVCLGDSVLLVAKPIFPYSEENAGTGYSQTVDNCTYTWAIGGVGTLASTNDSVWFTPPARQGYFVDCRVADIFPHQERVTCKIRVSQLPNFAGTGPLEDTVCLNVSTELLGGVTPTDTVGVAVPPGSFPVGGSFAGLTYLPDGSGVSYQTTINIAGLGAGTITSPNDLASICLDIEHSFLGDLEIGLTCPNGTYVSLANTYPGTGPTPAGCSGGGTFLGNDTDEDGGAPGSPVETYCFSVANATFGTMCNETGNTVPNAYGDAMMDPSGVYLPDGDWNDFIGCPLEGPWTITVQDNQGIDDGYIFQWSILFDQALYPNPETYQNVIVTDFWSADPTIVTGQNDTSIIVLPVVSGPHSYTYNVTDDFGCEYDTTVVLFAIDNPIIFPDTNTCHFIYVSQGNFAYEGGVWSSADTCIHFLPNNTELNPTIVSSLPGIHTVTFTDNACNVTQSSDIYFQPYPYTEVFDATNCEGTATQLLAASGPENDSYVWNTGEQGLSIYVTQQGTYWVTTFNECGQWTDSASFTTRVCDIQAPNIIVLSSTQGNNAWFINYDGIAEYSVTIVNRWQNIVFESIDPTVQWKGQSTNGTDVSEGTYFYTIKATMLNGESLEKQGFIQVYH